MTKEVTWVIDTSSVAEVRRSIENVKKPGVFLRMESLVNESRLVYPKQVVDEIERWADPAHPMHNMPGQRRTKGKPLNMHLLLNRSKKFCVLFRGYSILTRIPELKKPTHTYWLSPSA